MMFYCRPVVYLCVVSSQGYLLWCLDEREEVEVRRRGGGVSWILAMYQQYKESHQSWRRHERIIEEKGFLVLNVPSTKKTCYF